MCHDFFFGRQRPDVHVNKDARLNILPLIRLSAFRINKLDESLQWSMLSEAIKIGQLYSSPIELVLIWLNLIERRISSDVEARYFFANK